MNRSHIAQQVLQHTAVAWNDGLGAAADHDVLAARRIMRGAAARRTLLRAAPGDMAPDLAKINRLLGRLAQSILASPGVVSLAEPERAAVETSRRIGFERLTYFSWQRCHTRHREMDRLAISALP